MKLKINAVINAVLIFCISITALTVTACAAEKPPSLVAISFKNAELDTEFKEDESSYTITLNDNTASPTLKGYGIRGEADIFVSYLYDETQHQTGITVTLKFETGSRIYNFDYSNPAAYDKNGDNALSSIYSMYGELSPKLSADETQYKLYIPSDLTELEITPVTSDINAYCAPVRLTLSEKQEPKITLTCTASNGQKKDYTVKIKRVDKTAEQVKYEMAQPGYESFVDGTRLFEKPAFLVTVGAFAGGALVIWALFILTARIAVNPYDKDEEAFFAAE